MKWFTCSPAPFRADHTFFHRDTGAFATAFRELGVESKSVLLLPWQEGDVQEHTIRATMQELSSVEWWQQWKLDGIVLYSWARPEFTPIIRALHQAGVKVVMCLDTNGQLYPWACNWGSVTKCHFKRNMAYKGRVKGFMIALVKAVFAHTFNWYWFDWRSREHSDYADLIGIPHMEGSIANYKRHPFLLSDTAKERIVPMWCPIPSVAHYDGREKERVVLFVGRWDDPAPKRPQFMMNTVEAVVRLQQEVMIGIAGTLTAEIEAWYAALDDSVKSRVKLIGLLPNIELQQLYRRAMISVCTSEWEGTHLASLEALCSGASVVAPKKAMLTSLQTYTQEGCGRLAPQDTPESVATAVVEELATWEAGERDPAYISARWTKRTHAIETVRRILAWAATGDQSVFDLE